MPASQSSPLDPPLRIGLVGAGFLARTRVRNWTRTTDARITALATSKPDTARAFAASVGLPDSAVCQSYAELLDRDDVDAVDLCVPNPVHRTMTEQAAAKGKHVICTKPLVGFPGKSADDPGDPVPDAEAMASSCAAAGVHLCYAENWIYAPSVLRAAALHEKSGGVILEMRGWEAHSGSHAEYAKAFATAGGGALLRLGSHPIGVMLALKSEEGLRIRGKRTRVVEVMADAGDMTKAEGLTPANTRVATGWHDVENWGVAILKFDDGTRGVAYGSDNCLGGMQSRMEISTSNAQFHCNLSPNDGLRSYATEHGTFGDAYIMEKAHTDAGWNTPIPDEDWSSGQLGMIHAFASDLRAGRTPRSDGWLGAEVMRVLSAAYRSAREGRRVGVESS